jgi:hypothetical protein
MHRQQINRRLLRLTVAPDVETAIRQETAKYYRLARDEKRLRAGCAGSFASSPRTWQIVKYGEMTHLESVQHERSHC